MKPLKSVDSIDDYECLMKYVFSDSFRRCVIANNGGRPNEKIFDTNKAKGYELKSFLSFNKEDRETIWKVSDWNKEELSNKYIPFAIDNFGNLICFDINTDKIVFINHENMTIEIIADNFDSFMDSLYE